MSLSTINGEAILLGMLHLPSVGNWTGSFQTDEIELTSGQNVELGVGSSTLNGFVLEGVAWQGRGLVWVAGGSGGLRKASVPKGYRNVTARIVASDILRESGETLAATSDSLATILPFYARDLGTFGIALSTLCERIGTAWRMLIDGTVHIGTVAGRAIKEYELLERLDGMRCQIAFTEDLPILPGDTINEGVVANVNYNLGNMRGEVFLVRS